VYLWRWDTGEEPKKFTSLSEFGTELIGFAPDGKTLFVAGGDRRVLTFEIATGRQTGSFDLGSPWKWAFSPDGKTLATVNFRIGRSEAQAVVLWDPATGKEKGRLPIGRSSGSHVSWSPDGKLLAAMTDYRIRVWDVATGQALGPSRPGHEGNIGAFAFAPDGRLFTASDDHTIRSWDAAGKPGLELIHDHWVRDVAVSPDGALVVGSALSNDLQVWDAKTGTERFKLLGNGKLGGTRKVRFTPDGQRLVAWGDDLHLRVWDMRNGKLLAESRTLPAGKTEADLDDDSRDQLMVLGLGAADISADGSTLAFCPYKLAQVFDVKTGQERLKFEVDPNGVAKLALSPDGTRLAIGGRGKSINTRLPGGGTRHSAASEHQTAVWDLAAKKVVWQAASPGSWSGELVFSPDGKRLAESVSTEDKKYAIQHWDAATGKDLGRIDLPQRGSHLAFDRAGQRLAVSNQDTTATVYDIPAALKPNEPK
jgi:WD40 repeat protein